LLNKQYKMNISTQLQKKFNGREGDEVESIERAVTCIQTSLTFVSVYLMLESIMVSFKLL
jgi:hypothetical protein